MTDEQRSAELAEVGARLKHIRNTIKISQVELAENIGCTGTRIHYMERGKGPVIDYDVLAVLYKKYYVSSHYILFGEGPMLVPGRG